MAPGSCATHGPMVFRWEQRSVSKGAVRGRERANRPLAPEAENVTGRPDGADAAAVLPTAGDEDVAGLAAGGVRVEGSAAEESSGRARQTRLMAWLFRSAEVPREVAPPEFAPLVSADENFVWVDLAEYAEGALRDIAGPLALHHTAVRIALLPWQRPRVDQFDGQFLASVTIPHIDVERYRVEASQLDLFVGPNYLVSAHKQLLPFTREVLARASRSPHLVRLDAAFMLYIVLDETLAYYERLNERVQVEIERMEERALRDTSETFLGDLLRLKRFIFALGQLADQHREVFAAFLRPDFAFVSGHEVEPYFRDLEVRLGRLLDVSLATRETVNGAFDIYVSHVAYRTNQVIKILTIVSTVLLPASVILALFSATFEGVPEYGLTAPIVMLATTLAITAVIAFSFRRWGWI